MPREVDVAKAGEPEPWRRSVLDGGSTVLAALALLWLALFYAHATEHGVQNYLIAVVAMLLPAAMRPLGYRLRAILQVSGLAGVVVVGSLIAGPTVGVIMAALLMIVSSGLLFGTWQAVLAWPLSAALLAAGLKLFANGHGAQALELLDPHDSANLARMVGAYLGLSSLLAVGVSVVINRLSQSLKESEQAAGQAWAAQQRAELAAKEEQTARAQLIEAQRFQVLAVLSGSIAHNLNNSLQVILGSADLLRSQQFSREEALDIATDMHDVALEASLLTRQLLTLGKQVVLNQEVLDVGAELGRIASSLRRVLPADVVFNQECGLDLFANVDAFQLKQALLNLTLNAAHAMPRGGSLTLRAHADVASNRIAISLEDTGSGMDESILAKLFEPFFTTKGHGGSGLGLPTVQAIMEQHGGSLAVSSQPGRGSTFQLFLPHCAAPNLHSRAVRTRQDERLNGLNVLLVDDDARLLPVMRRMLEIAGARVITASSADEAIAYSLTQRSERLDVLCTDAVMPGAPTLALLDHFESERPDSVIVVASAHVPGALLRKGISSHKYCHIAKPFTSAELVGTILDARGQLARTGLSPLLLK